MGDLGKSARGRSIVLGLVIVLVGGWGVISWGGPEGLFGDSYRSWFGTTMSYGLMLVLIGSIGVVHGLRRQQPDDRGTPVPGSLRTKLVAWNLASGGGLADLERRISTYQRSLAATTGIATSVAIILAGAALSMIAWKGLGISKDGPSGYLGASNLFLGATYLTLLIGTGLGYPLAAHLEQRRLPAGPRYADLRQRRLADYRSPRLRWLPFAALAVQTAAAVLFLLAGGASIALLMPLLGALAFAVGELLMWSAVRVARTVVTDDPVTARRCDDLVRAEIIARLQCWQLLSVGSAGLVGMAIAAAYARTELSGIVLAAGALSAGFSFLCGFVCLFGERLGGTITGWWWIHTMPE